MRVDTFWLQCDNENLLALPNQVLHAPFIAVLPLPRSVLLLTNLTEAEVPC